MRPRYIFLIIFLLLGPIWWFWAETTAHYMTPWIRIIASILTVFLLLLWYLFVGPGRWAVRLAVFVGIIAIVIGTGAFLGNSLEYVGSVDGSSLPKLAWKSEESLETIPEPLAEKTTTEVSLSESALPGLADSPRFLAPNGVGEWSLSSLQANFDNWSASPPEELWRVAMGAGWSGFSVTGHRALTLEQLGEEETVTCYDIANGNLLWKTGIDARYFSDAPSQMPQMAGDGPRSTPTVVGDRVYTHGATGVILCLDLSSGDIIWEQSSIGEMSKLPEWGKSSAILHLPKENLIVTTGPETRGPSLAAFDASTGKPAWQFTEEVLSDKESENFGGSYSTPRLVTLLGRRQIISVNASSITGNDPATGEQLWRYIWPGKFPKVSQPHLVSDNGKTARIFASASYGAGSPLIEISRDFSVSEVWVSTKLKTKFSSAVVLDGYAYGIDEAKPACIDLTTGDKVWKARTDYNFGQNILVGDNVLVQAEQGHIAVFEASPDGFAEVSRIEGALNDLTWNVPTLAGRYLLIRNSEEAVCYRLPAKIR